MKLLNRQEFASMWDNISAGYGLSGSPLWIPEKAQDRVIRCRWFVSIQPPVYDQWNLDQAQQYWSWCEEYLLGSVRCFSSSEEEEWWGFTNRKDVDWWLLKWVN